MRTSALLWQQNQDLVQSCLHHPFLQGLKDGSLLPEQFRYYVGQDAFFLAAFARAYCLAAARCPDWDGFAVFHRLAGGVIAELKLHGSYAERWGVDLSLIEPDPSTRRYTDFLLATAYSADVATISAAMAPCLRLYAFLGERLATDGIPSHRYGEWIRTYSDPAFADLACQLEATIDRYSPEPSPILSSAYRYAMVCERDFFEAAWVAG